MSEQPATLPQIGATSGSTPLVAGMLFHLFSPAFLVGSLVVLLLAPPAPALLFCAALYGIVVLGEATCGVYSPESLALLAGYAALTVAFYAAAEARPALYQYAGIGILAMLALVQGALLISQRPLAGFYLHGRGYRQLQLALTRLWLVAYGSGLAASLTVIATPWFHYVPLVSVMAGTAGILMLSFITFGTAHRRARKFELGDYAFREAERTADARAAFLEAYAEEIWSSVNRGSARGQGAHSKAAILEDAWRTEQAITDQGSVYYFNAFHQGRIVGGIGVVLDRPGRRLPAEEGIGVSLDRLREIGRVMEVRRLSIDREHRLQPDILRGLFKCIIEVALENRVSFIVDFAFSFAAPVLDKVGLRILNIPGCDVRMFGAPMRLLAMNLAALTVTKAQGVTSAASVGGLLNAYLLDRYVKQLVLRQGWRFESRRSWSLSVPHIEKLCVATGTEAADIPDVGRERTKRSAQERKR